MATVEGYAGIGEEEYRRRIRAWTLYDWANSAFATTILAAVLPVYYSQVAGSTLASPAIATALWTTTLSVSLVIVAILAPILGTVSDVMRGKKRFLSIFVGLGVVGTGLLVLVGSGDWLLASIFFLVGRVGFAAANVFYDALLPHVAREEDRDRVSTAGYATGYLGGGLLLAINIVMIFVIGDEWGARLSFLSVAVWWAVFSIPILRIVPEPPSAAVRDPSVSVVRASFARLRGTLANLRRYKELFKYLIAFLVYNDGIGTIIGVAVIYGAELGFGSIELVAAILLVQFVGIPFALVFGRIPSRDERRRAVFLAFVVYNIVALPLVGMVGGAVLDDDVIGAAKPETVDTASALGEGEYGIDARTVALVGDWTVRSADELGAGAGSSYAFAAAPGARFDFAFNGQLVEVTYARGPDRGDWAVLIDGDPVIEDDEPLVIEGYNSVERFGETVAVDAGSVDEHVLSIVATADRDEDATGTVVAVGEVEVLPTPRTSNLGTILGLLLVIEFVGLGFALLAGDRLFGRAVERFDTKRTIVLALVAYAIIAVWGFFLDAVIEFWFLAWMVAVVQGGSQALSRSLYAGMSPAAESGEFFGFFSVMEKFSAILGPLVFAGAVALFDSSRPAVLGLIVFFVAGIVLLQRVDVDEGRRVAREADARHAAAGEIE
jgi:MFS transporter, UMF1 family